MSPKEEAGGELAELQAEVASLQTRIDQILVGGLDVSELKKQSRRDIIIAVLTTRR